MANNQIFPAFLAKTHKKNHTPYTAVSIISLVVFIIPIVLLAIGNQPNDVFGWVATVATFGFLLAYVLIVVAGPLYLYRQKLLEAKHVAIAVVSMAILLIAIAGSVYPVPAYPYSLFPYIFLAWMAIGVVWAVYKLRNPRLVGDNEHDLQLTPDQLPGVGRAAGKAS